MDLPVTPDREGPVPVVPVRFWTAYGTSGTETVEFDMVRWTRKGSNGATNEEKVTRLAKFEPHVWGAIKPYYDAWKNGQDAPINGTPLAAWPGVTTEQVEILHRFNLRSVEDIAEVSDSDLVKVPLPNVRGIQKNARAFIETSKDRSVVQAELASRDEKIEELTARVEELTAIIAARDPEALAEAPKRRGRPPKVEAA